MHQVPFDPLPKTMSACDPKQIAVRSDVSFFPLAHHFPIFYLAGLVLHVLNSRASAPRQDNSQHLAQRGILYNVEQQGPYTSEERETTSRSVEDCQPSAG